MKLNKKIVIVTISIILMIIVCKIVYNPITLINIHWNLKLPIPDKELYFYDSGASFFGDGYTYMVVKYTGKRKQKVILNNINWNSTISADELSEINKLVDEFEIDENHTFQLNENNLYFHLIGDDKWSKIYLIYSVKDQKIYILEDII